MQIEEKAASPLIVWLSVIHVLFLVSLPTLANFVIWPTIVDQWQENYWIVFCVIGVPIGFMGVSALNPFPRNLPGALLRTFFLPVSTAMWWGFQGGELADYFVIMLVFEFLAIFLSLFIMCFIPLRCYDPANPKAGSFGYQILIIVLHGFLASGGLTALLLISVWPWATGDNYWWQPITAVFLLVAAIEYLICNFKLQLRCSADRWRVEEGEPTGFPDSDVSIEPVMILAPLPWLMSFWFMG